MKMWIDAKQGVYVSGDLNYYATEHKNSDGVLVYQIWYAGNSNDRFATRTHIADTLTNSFEEVNRIVAKLELQKKLQN
ncbi:MAG: hypothetical protein ACK5DE_03245 [Bacteroidota bacterium]|jgi:hypothetical protein